MYILNWTLNDHLTSPMWLIHEMMEARFHHKKKKKKK